MLQYAVGDAGDMRSRRRENQGAPCECFSRSFCQIPFSWLSCMLKDQKWRMWLLSLSSCFPVTFGF